MAPAIDDTPLVGHQWLGRAEEFQLLSPAASRSRSRNDSEEVTPECQGAVPSLGLTRRAGARATSTAKFNVADYQSWRASLSK